MLDKCHPPTTGHCAHDILIVVVGEVRCPPWSGIRITAVYNFHFVVEDVVDGRLHDLGHTSGRGTCWRAFFDHVQIPVVLVPDNAVQWCQARFAAHGIDRRGYLNTQRHTECVQGHPINHPALVCDLDWTS